MLIQKNINYRNSDANEYDGHIIGQFQVRLHRCVQKEVPLLVHFNPGGRGVLPEKLGIGVRPACQNPYPIHDQNLWFSLSYLWPDQKFDTLFMTWL